MTITIDDATQAIIDTATTHETEHGNGFCSDSRAQLVAHVMFNLDLQLEDIGLVATAFMGRVLDDNDDNDVIEDTFPDTIGGE